MDKHDILDMFEFFSDAPPPLKERILSAGSVATIPPATYCFQEGNSCSNIALVGQGTVRVFKSSPEGREVTLYHVDAGQMCLLTLQSALSGEAYSASAVTETAVEAVTLPVETFRTWVAEYSHLRTLVFSTMVRRLTDLMTLVQEIAFRRLDQRLAGFLLEHAGAGASHDQPVVATHQAIADELGTAREVVSRLLKELERTGAIDLARGQIHLKDLQVLRSMAPTRA